MDNAIDVAAWLLSAVSIIGTVSVTHKRVSGMYLWAGANAGWILIFLLKGVPSASVMYAVYFGLTVYGVWKWKKDRRS